MRVQGQDGEAPPPPPDRPRAGQEVQVRQVPVHQPKFVALEAPFTAARRLKAVQLSVLSVHLQYDGKLDHSVPNDRFISSATGKHPQTHPNDEQTSRQMCIWMQIV